ncbi:MULTISPECIES: hypothetical protein [unclassified Spirosoma]|uniref:hypothetical protein n=1 Tax=unclassified Spirosoma TaxID=2621999 RepID=UPI00095FDE25|nr:MULTISPECIES: hypothetical protein [unclassified Spirosoma]MBN8822318.1 hypothetical protein [Spirosoma sp.]OJW72382.1 MAG: hypothetical protein BGO59_14670 [Spirosoma sp. 48-14]
MHILTQQAINIVSQKLHLPITGLEQDWDIELADSSRIDEFLTLFKQDNNLDNEQKYVLMALILASCDDALQEGKALSRDSWTYIEWVLKTHSIYHALIDYWGLPTSKNENDLFALTPYIRAIY